ncbi:hypothetical protein AB1Y20_013900 [Prymnesium parvum]|uniref:Protein xylosyltransferase n=1 Tax=Prymnesium parvum TaxID=97485 RepID=A0AB34IEX9_PRYPA
MQSLPTNDEVSHQPADRATVAVCRPGQSYRMLHPVDSSTTISQLKASLGASAPEKAQLVYGGSVLNDEDRLSDLALGESPTLWLLSGASHNHQDLLSAARQLGIFAALGKLQSVDLPASISLLRGFCDSLTEQSSPWRPAKAEQDALCAAVSTLESEGPAFNAVAHATWFCEYGCCLLASVPRVGVVQLRLVCLDEWRFRMQAESDVRTHTADAAGYVVDHVGEVLLSDYKGFLVRTIELLEERRAAKRHHQYTPPMIKAVMTDALSNALHCTNDPRGGFTDVGLHTGGQPRDTAWPLVQAVMQAVLDDADEFLFYRHAMAQLKLWIVEMMVLEYQSTCDCDGQKKQVDTDSCVHALSVAVLEGSSLADEQTHIRDGDRRKLDMDAFEARCVYARWQLEQARDTLSRAVAGTYQLPLFSTPDLQCRNPELFPPKPTTPAQAEFDLRAAQKVAHVNLGALPSPSPKSISDLPEWLGRLNKSSLATDGTGIAFALLCLETVERAFFQEAASLMPPESNALDDSSSELYVKAIDDAVDSYRGVMSVFRDSSEATALLSVERDSRELLVVWCAFCLVHKATLPFEFQVLRSFGVSLKPNDLQHLVLSERLSINAAQSVVAYLRHHTKPGRHIFSLRPGDATFELASMHALRSPNAISMWESEKEQAEQRKNEHWREVQTKQARLRVLDEQLAEYRTSLKTATDKRELYRHENGEYDKWLHYQKQAIKYAALIRDTEYEISETEIPPRAIFQPLPAVENKALPIMFFLTMPKRFQALSRLSFLAQQMLLPRHSQVAIHISGDSKATNVNILQQIKENEAQTCWRSYYLTRSTARSLNANDAVVSAVRLASDDKVAKEKDFSPSNVRSFHSPTIGVWHPDSLSPRLTWNEGFQNFDHRNTACFNPFADLPTAVLVARFSELLPEQQRNMQWAMAQKGALSEASRGNVPEACQDIKPSWLAGKTEFFAFGAMRAYPNQQVRKLCIALRERSLPLDDPAVRKLLQQTLFQLGELSEGMQPEPMWRTDLANHDGWAVLRSELSKLADELKLKPREHAAVLILGELAAHASQWDALSRDVIVRSRALHGRGRARIGRQRLPIRWRAYVRDGPFSVCMS